VGCGVWNEQPVAAPLRHALRDTSPGISLRETEGGGFRGGGVYPGVALHTRLLAGRPSACGGGRLFMGLKPVARGPLTSCAALLMRLSVASLLFLGGLCVCMAGG
jgi:hypothetical protein